MKKILLSLSAVLVSLAAMATDYSGNLTVTVNGEGSTQTSTITINQNDNGKYTLSLKNFTLVSGETTMPVGNIVIENVTGGVSGTTTTLYVNKKINITAGDAEGVDTWIGPMLGEVPVVMTARFNSDNYLTVTIDIDMQASLSQTINVKFDNVGNHFQMPNGDFETWTSANNAPRYWHGFESVQGTWSSFAKSSSKLNSSTDVRTGSTSTKSALLTSTSIFGVVANGTMTNGILNAGSMSATDASNHSETNLSSTSTDANGDPFATAIYAKPDAVKFWLKFSQGTANSSYPYASFNAVITDGTFYQDPEDKTYTNKVAVAAPDQSKMTTGDWREVTCNFDYASYAANNAEAKAVLMTFSTNATPGKGSSGDKVYIDDVEFIYNAKLTALSYKGEALDIANNNTFSYEIDADATVSAADFATTVEGADAKVTVVVDETETGYQAVITVVSGDLQTATPYVVNFTKKASVVIGDVNGDGSVDVADATAVISAILGGNPSPYNATAADVDGNGTVDVADVTALINKILN